jgi:hypothetical protein
MKYAIAITIMILAAPVYGQGPLDTIFWSIANFTTTAQASAENFTFTATHPGDQSGQGWNPTDIEVGYRVVDGQARVYEVLSISADFTSSSGVLKELQDKNIGPAGVGYFYRPIPGSEKVPVPPGGNLGLAPSTLAKIATHNALNGGSGGAGTITTDDTFAGDGSSGDPLRIYGYYQNDAAAAAGGVPVGGMYKAAFGNKYGMSYGAIRIRVD